MAVKVHVDFILNLESEEQACLLMDGLSNGEISHLIKTYLARKTNVSFIQDMNEIIKVDSELPQHVNEPVKKHYTSISDVKKLSKPEQEIPVVKENIIDKEIKKSSENTRSKGVLGRRVLKRTGGV